MAALEPHIEALHNIMISAKPPPGVQPLENANALQPLGSVRLKMIEFFIIVLHANNAAVNKKLLELNIIPCYIVSSLFPFSLFYSDKAKILLFFFFFPFFFFLIHQDLFFKYELNNFLHSLVHDMIVKIFSSELDNSDDLMLNVLKEARLTERIVSSCKENDADM